VPALLAPKGIELFVEGGITGVGAMGQLGGLAELADQLQPENLKQMIRICNRLAVRRLTIAFGFSPDAVTARY
jgi:hypothetical protein